MSASDHAYLQTCGVLNTMTLFTGILERFRMKIWFWFPVLWFDLLISQRFCSLALFCLIIQTNLFNCLLKDVLQGVKNDEGKLLKGKIRSLPLTLQA